LLAIGDRHSRRRGESKLVGRTWELNTVAAILDEAVDGSGAVVSFMGPPGIGKSRMVREAAAVAANRGIPVFTAYCESHAADIPFHAVARLLRDAKTWCFCTTCSAFARRRCPTSPPTPGAGG
jgi:adenylate cyclase